MGVIENNGAVTLPESRTDDPLIAKRRLQVGLLVVAMLVRLVFLAVRTR